MKTTTLKTSPVKKVETTKPVDNYKSLVIGTNKNLKSFTKSTGGAIKVVLLYLKKII